MKWPFFSFAECGRADRWMDEVYQGMVDVDRWMVEVARWMAEADK